MSETITREQAIALGLKRYRDGTACRHGHIGQRYTRDETCCICAVERGRLHRSMHPAAPRARGPRRRKAKSVKIPVAPVKRISSFIAPPSLDRLMARR